LLLQASIEGEVAAILGRERYERATAYENAVPECATGYRPTTINPPDR
jgi:hypothetical protein